MYRLGLGCLFSPLTLICAPQDWQGATAEAVRGVQADSGAPLSPLSPHQVRAFGSGLAAGVAGHPAPFTIDTTGAGPGALGLTVEGPGEAALECQDHGDGTCAVTYVPAAPGDYAVNILFAGTHVPGSPFHAAIAPEAPTTAPAEAEAPPTAGFDASKVTCSGPGLRRAVAGQPGHFRVDCSRAGTAELTIEIESAGGARAEVRVDDAGDGTYTIAYAPLRPGTYTVTIKYGGQPVPSFPCTLLVEPEPGHSPVVYGPGIEGTGTWLGLRGSVGYQRWGSRGWRSRNWEAGAHDPQPLTYIP